LEEIVRTLPFLALMVLPLFAVTAGSGNKPSQATQGKLEPVVTYLTASSCAGPIGGNVSSILREKIRSSAGYTLADTPAMPENALGPEIMLMCADLADEPRTAVSYLISFRVGRTRDIGLRGLDIVGRTKVDQEAQDIFSQFDNWWTEFSATQSYYKKKQ
jgi:hypothetical protein